MKWLASLRTTCVVSALALAASTATVRAQNVDSLIALLRSDSVAVRSMALVTLNTVPTTSMNAAHRAAIISLLDREARGTRTSSDPTYPGPQDETWPEYIITLTDAAIRIGDATALRGVVRLGIQTSDDASHFVGDFGAAALPFLDSAWVDQPTARPSIVGTWGYMIRPGSPLGGDARALVESRLLSPDDTFPVNLAATAQQYQLVGLLPLIDSLAKVASDPGDAAFLAGTSAVLTPIYRARSPNALMTDLTEWFNAVCARPSGAQVGYCTSVHARLAAASGLVTGRQYTAAKAILEAIARTTIGMQRTQVIGGLEAAMIITGARRLASQLP